jgi:hypothetical protein
LITLNIKFLTIVKPNLLNILKSVDVFEVANNDYFNDKKLFIALLFCDVLLVVYILTILNLMTGISI